MLWPPHHQCHCLRVAVAPSSLPASATLHRDRTVFCCRFHSHCRCWLPPPAVAAAGASPVTPTQSLHTRHLNARACTPCLYRLVSPCCDAYPSPSVLQGAAPLPSRDDLQFEFDAEKARATLLSGAGDKDGGRQSRASQGTLWCNGTGPCNRCSSSSSSPCVVSPCVRCRCSPSDPPATAADAA
jgi:hypothetical protein